MTSMYATPGTRDRFRGDGRLVLRGGADALRPRRTPGPARPSPEKQRPTRASAAVRGTAPHNEFFNELATQDTSSPATPEPQQPWARFGRRRQSRSRLQNVRSEFLGDFRIHLPRAYEHHRQSLSPEQDRRFARSAFSGNPITQRTSTLPVLKFSELACHVVPSPTAVILIPKCCWKIDGDALRVRSRAAVHANDHVAPSCLKPRRQLEVYLPGAGIKRRNGYTAHAEFTYLRLYPVQRHGAFWKLEHRIACSLTGSHCR